MKIDKDFNYFANQQVSSSKDGPKADSQDFDLDLQTVNRSVHEGSGPILQGSGHFWCHITDSCTGAVCTVTVSLIACGEK